MVVDGELVLLDKINERHVREKANVLTSDSASCVCYPNAESKVGCLRCG